MDRRRGDRALERDVLGAVVVEWQPGGVMTVFCDGHMRFFSNSVDLTVWRAVSTRNMGEVVSDL